MDELIGYVLLEAMDGYSSREWPEQSRRITREVIEMVKRIQAETWTECVRAMEWAQLNGTDPLAYAYHNNPYEA